jgi:methane monooxygenase component A beta chain/propane monooxygenase small subunit
MTTERATLQGNRKFVWFTPAGRFATEYEMFTIGQQSSPSQWLDVDWPLRFDDGRPPYSVESTAVRCSDWERFRDPAQLWYRPYVAQTNHEEQALERLVPAALADGVADRMEPAWLEHVLQKYYAAWPFVEYGLFLALCHPVREALGDTVMFVTAFQAADKMRHVQDIVHLTFDLADVLPGFDDTGARAAWMTDAALVPVRETVEALLVADDWMEVLAVINLVFEPLVGSLMATHFMASSAAHHGDPVTPLVLAGTRRNAARHLAAVKDLVRVLVEDPEHGAANRAVVSGWIDAWVPRVDEAAVALSAVFTLPGISAGDPAEALATVRSDLAAIRTGLGV